MQSWVTALIAGAVTMCAIGGLVAIACVSMHTIKDANVVALAITSIGSLTAGGAVGGTAGFIMGKKAPKPDKKEG